MPTINPPPTLQQREAERMRPDTAPVGYNHWEQLLFLHWRWDAAAVQATLPPGLFVDVCEGSAWLAVVPFFMRDVRPRFVPAIAPLSDFLEMNVRTYAFDAKGRPGVYFYSLDCNQPLAVETARRLLLMRYQHATMHAEVDSEGWVDFDVQRRGEDETARFRYRASDSPEAREAGPDSLEYFLLERYRLFATDQSGERLSSMRVCHPAYRYRPAAVEAWSAAPLRQAGFDPGERPPDHVCAAEPVDVELFAPESE